MGNYPYLHERLEELVEEWNKDKPLEKWEDPLELMMDEHLRRKKDQRIFNPIKSSKMDQKG